ncbi:hypothetical protein AAZX31_13G158500 [Glycine max]
MHMRCSAHILNLIVSGGLKEIDLSIRKIRVACKFVKSSLSRFASFKRCDEEVSVSTKAMLILDVPTRWNSTYLMLDVVEKYEHHFITMSMLRLHMITTNVQLKFNKY